MLVSLYPVLDGASYQHFLFLGQPIWPDPAVERHSSSWPEGGREVGPVAIYPSKIHVQHVFTLGRRDWWQWLLFLRLLCTASLNKGDKSLFFFILNFIFRFFSFSIVISICYY